MNAQRLWQIQEMLKSEPDDLFLNYALALEYANANDVKKAIELLEVLLKNNPHYLAAYYQLGKYYAQTAQNEFAIATYNKGITIAQQQHNFKTAQELKQALLMLEEE